MLRARARNCGQEDERVTCTRHAGKASEGPWCPGETHPTGPSGRFIDRTSQRLHSGLCQKKTEKGSRCVLHRQSRLSLPLDAVTGLSCG